MNYLVPFATVRRWSVETVDLICPAQHCGVGHDVFGLFAIAGASSRVHVRSADPRSSELEASGLVWSYDLVWRLGRLCNVAGVGICDKSREGEPKTRRERGGEGGA